MNDQIMDARCRRRRRLGAAGGVQAGPGRGQWGEPVGGALEKVRNVRQGTAQTVA